MAESGIAGRSWRNRAFRNRCARSAAGRTRHQRCEQLAFVRKTLSHAKLKLDPEIIAHLKADKGHWLRITRLRRMTGTWMQNDIIFADHVATR